MGTMTLQPVQSPDDAAAAFRAALDRFDPARRPLILGHFDADGLAAVAILARMLDRAGRPADIRIMGKGENPGRPRRGTGFQPWTRAG
ncbi:hypothetical protein ACFSYD_20495 [Paracoccus aerius]